MDRRLQAPDAQPITSRLAAAGSRRRELEAVLAATPANATREDYATLILEQNVAGKTSAVSRVKLLKQLRERYLLDPSFAEFLALRNALAAESNSVERGLLCYLMMARCDRLFRETSLLLLSQCERRSNGFSEPRRGLETEISGAGFAPDFRRHLEGRQVHWSGETEEHARQHVLAALKDFGLLRGSARKKPVTFWPGPVTGLFAARLAELEGLTASQTLVSRWFALLGLDRERASSVLRTSQQAGLLTFRMQAQVVELVLPRLGAL